jgi:hypothetical protein
VLVCEIVPEVNVGLSVLTESLFSNSTLSSSSVWSETFTISLSSNLTVFWDSSSFYMVDFVILVKFPELGRHLMTFLRKYNDLKYCHLTDRVNTSISFSIYLL